MIYLTTGANGSGKTLLTLKDVREQQLKENRPVFYNGRFELVADFGWEKIDAKDWESCPDGAIFLFDECHNDFPLRGRGEPPKHVSALGEHRRRGFDFWLITQHPMNIDPFIRRIIGTPGWHRHLKRAPAGDLVSVLTWSSVNPQCEKAGSGESGETKMVPMPKDVYAWYRSASLHTGKARIPRAVYVLVGAAVLVPVLAWYAYHSLFGGQAKRATDIGTKAGVIAGEPGPGRGGGRRGPVTADGILRSFNPRIEGLPFTAPRYDDLTKPVRVPVMVGCWVQGQDFGCISQQGTRLVVKREHAEQFIANHGFFLDFDPGTAPGGSSGEPGRPGAPADASPAPVVSNAPAVRS